MLYVAKMLALVNAALGQACALRVDKAIDGAEPRKTNDFLQLLAFACRAPNVAKQLPALTQRAVNDAAVLVAEALALEAAEAQASAAATAEADLAAAQERARAPAVDGEGTPRGAAGGGRAHGTRPSGQRQPDGSRSAGAAGAARPSGAARAGARGAADGATGARGGADGRPRAAPAVRQGSAATPAAGPSSDSHASAARTERGGPEAGVGGRQRSGSASCGDGAAGPEAARSDDDRGGSAADAPARPGARAPPVRTPEPARPFRAHSMPAFHAPPRAPPDDGSWACARCSERNGPQDPYCEHCATIRRAGSNISAASEPACMRRIPSAAGSVHRTNSDSWWSPPHASASRLGSDDEAERGGSPARAGGCGAPASCGRGAESAPKPARRPSRQESGGARTVEDLFGADEDASRQAGWYERKLHRQWSSHQQREKTRDEAEDLRRARDEAAEEARQLRGAAERGAASAARLGDARRHEARWASFVGALPERIRFADVPWLPIESEELLAEALGLGAGPADPAARKKAHRAASMRWHPDRFTQQFGARVLEGEYERVMARVTATSQAINTMVR